MINNILINTVVPVLFAYGHYQQQSHFKWKAVHWLENIPAEKNVITRKWEELGIINKNAWDSQALIELKPQYCDARRCLECAIGNQLLKTKS
jgi:hypothetical protein